MSKVQAKSPLPHAESLVEHDHGVQFLRELYRGLLAHAAAEIGSLFTTLAEPTRCRLCSTARSARTARASWRRCC